MGGVYSIYVTSHNVCYVVIICNKGLLVFISFISSWVKIIIFFI